MFIFTGNIEFHSKCRVSIKMSNFFQNVMFHSIRRLSLKSSKFTQKIHSIFTQNFKFHLKCWMSLKMLNFKIQMLEFFQNSLFNSKFQVSLNVLELVEHWKFDLSGNWFVKWYKLDSITLLGFYETNILTEQIFFFIYKVILNI